jgi:hypothetical protein
MKKYVQEDENEVWSVKHDLHDLEKNCLFLFLNLFKNKHTENKI